MCNMTKADVKQIYDNREDIAVIKNDISHISTGVDEIKNNHLVHISRELKDLRVEVDAIEKIQHKQSPFIGLLNKAVEIVVMGVVIAVLVVIGINR